MKKRARILIIDDADSIRLAFGSFLESKGFEVFEAETGAKGLQYVQHDSPDVVLLDLKLPDIDGLELLGQILEENPFIVVIVVTALGTIEKALTALKLGAEKFLTKPFDPQSLLIVLQHSLHIQNLKKQEILTELTKQFEEHKYFFGTSIRMLQVLNLSKIINHDSNITVLIQGEQGTGKNTWAQWIHDHSERRSNPFVEIHCARLSKELLETELFGYEKGAFTGASSSKIGLLEIAHGGTLFLDEIGEMEMSVQLKVMKVLEQKKFRRLGSTQDRYADARMIATSQRSLEKLVRQGDFREDLFHRLNTMKMDLPALRDRKEDIIPLSEFFLNQMARDKTPKSYVLTEKARAVLQSYHWPGNIRELRNILERAFLLTPDKRIDADLLPIQRKIAFSELNASMPLVPLREMERKYITQVLASVNNNYSKAAEILKVNRNTLYNRLRDKKKVAVE